MPRAKKQHLKQRADGRFACRYKDQWFYGATEDEALQAREDYKQAEKRGEFARPKGPTVAEFANQWLPREKASASISTYNESAALLNKLIKHIGSMFFSDVKPSDIKAIYSEDFVGYSDSYIKSAAQLYRAMFDAAMEDGYCATNPARKKSSKPHKGTKGGNRAITKQEREWINTFCKDHRCFPAVMAMLYEGLRPPEAKAFNIDNAVFREEGVIRLSEFVHKGKKGVYRVDNQGKTEKSKREIPLFSPFAQAIQGKSGRLVFTANGGELTERAWRVLWLSYVHQMEKAVNGMEKRWYKRTRAHKKIIADAEALRKEGKTEEAAKKAVEIPPWINFTVKPYDLRHSFVTFCRDNDVDIKTCIKWMGHKDAKMILQIYDEGSEDRSKKEAQKIEKALSGSQNGSQLRVFHVKRSNIKASKQ